LESLDYFDINKEEALGFALNNNKGIVKVVMEEEYD